MARTSRFPRTRTSPEPHCSAASSNSTADTEPSLERPCTRRPRVFSRRTSTAGRSSDDVLAPGGELRVAAAVPQLRRDVVYGPGYRPRCRIGQRMVPRAARLEWGPGDYGPELGVLAQLGVEFADGHVQTMIPTRTGGPETSAVIENDLYDGQIIDGGSNPHAWQETGFVRRRLGRCPPGEPGPRHADRVCRSADPPPHGNAPGEDLAVTLRQDPRRLRPEPGRWVRLRVQGRAAPRSPCATPRCSSTTNSAFARCGARRHRLLHPLRRRRRVRADPDLPRLPVRRDHRLSRRAHAADRRGRRALGDAPHRHVRVLQPAAEPAAPATRSGASAAISSTFPPIARSATSGWAGPVTSPPSPPPPATSSTWPTSCTAGCSTSRPKSSSYGFVPFVVPDLLKLITNPAGDRAEASSHRDLGRCGGVGAVGALVGLRRPGPVWTTSYPAMVGHLAVGGGAALRHRALGHRLPVRRLARPDRAARQPDRGQGQQRGGRDRLPLPQRQLHRPCRPRCSAGTTRPPLDRTGGAHPCGVQPALRRRRWARFTPTRRRSTRSPSHFGLLDERRSATPANGSAELVAENDYRVATGFAGTPYVTGASRDRARRRRVPDAAADGKPVLALRGDDGRNDRLGAWDSMLPDGIDQPRPDDELQPLRARRGRRLDASKMVGGIRPARARLREGPHRAPPGGGITWSRTSLETPHGHVAVSWDRQSSGSFDLEVTVPDGVTALVRLPDGNEQEVAAGSHRLSIGDTEPAVSSRAHAGGFRV